MEERLKNIFDNVNYFLSFAEAKNAMIVVLNITLIIAESSVLLENNVSSWILLLLRGSLLILILSTVIVLYSFLPYLGKLDKKTFDKTELDNINLLFFGDIAKISNVETYIKLLQKKYGIDQNTKLENCCKDYAHEIIYNSKLALRKYKLFKYSLILTISSIATPIVPIIILIIDKRRTDNV